MSFNRNKYDNHTYDEEIDRSTNPLYYRVNNCFSNSVNECYPYNGITNKKNKKFDADKADIESELTNRNLPSNYSNKIGKNDKYLKLKQKETLKNCTKNMEVEDTRFTHPIDNYRGMSTTEYNLSPYLHVNPQNNINYWRDGINSRLVVRDSYRIPEQKSWDDNNFPVEKKYKKKKCRVNCD